MADPQNENKFEDYLRNFLATLNLSGGLPSWRRDLDLLMGGVPMQGTWGITNNASQLNNTYISNNASSAVNDAISYAIDLSAGTYTVYFCGVSTATSAVCDIALDGTSFASLDLYSASTAFSAMRTISGVVVPSDGQHLIRLAAFTRNASSTGFRILATKLVFVRN